MRFVRIKSSSYKAHAPNNNNIIKRIYFGVIAAVFRAFKISLRLSFPGTVKILCINSWHLVVLSFFTSARKRSARAAMSSAASSSWRFDMISVKQTRKIICIGIQNIN